MFSVFGNQNSGFGKPSKELSESADSDSACSRHVGNGFDATSSLLIFLASLAAANMGNDSFGGQDVVLGACLESVGFEPADGLEDG